MNKGRQTIWTDKREVTADNISEVLQKAWTAFSGNREDCDFLLRYDAGEQPLQREKKYRADINIECIDNVANEVTTFKTGYIWGGEITLVQRGTVDSGKANGSEHESVALLNECYSAEFCKAKTAELGRFVEVTGIGFTYTDVNTEYSDGDSYFKYVVLDPRFAFVVRSRAYADHRVVLGVTYSEDDDGNMHFTCFTKDRRFEMTGYGGYAGYRHDERSDELNPLGMIPIVEWVRDYDRMGCFERQIPDMDTLNIEESDFANIIDQNTQSIWHANDVEFAKDENGNNKTPKSNDWVFTQTTRDGKTPSITPLAVPAEYSGMLTNISMKRAMILQKCNVPQRNDNSGGSTGVAMSDATGWSQAEVEATRRQGIMESCKMQEIRIALMAISICPDVPSDSPLLRLRWSDVAPSIKRQKNYELATKVNAFATMVSHGISGLHAIRTVNLFDDPQQVYEDSKPLIDKYQKSIFERGERSNVQERAAADESDQIENSPNIDGMNRVSPDGGEE